MNMTPVQQQLIEQIVSGKLPLNCVLTRKNGKSRFAEDVARQYAETTTRNVSRLVTAETSNPE